MSDAGSGNKTDKATHQPHLNQMLFDTLPIGLAVCDMNGQMVRVNGAFAAIIGYSIEEVLDLTYWEVTPIEFEAQEQVQLSALNKTGRYGPYEKEYLHKSGKRIPVRLSGALIQENNQDFIWSSVEDISDLKEAQHNLQRANDDLENRVLERTTELQTLQNNLKNILDLAPEAIITADSRLTIQSFNTGAERIFGFKEEEVLKQSIEVLMPKRLHETHRKHVEDFNKSKEIYRLMDNRQELTCLRKDGTEFPAAASVSKHDVDGAPVYTVMIQDVTARWQAAESLRLALAEAERASQAKTDFLATMSHELRTPLNAIIGFSETMASEYFGALGSDRYVEYAQDIKSSGQHLLNLINDILDLSVIESGKRHLEKEQLPLHEIIAECAPMVTEFTKQKEIVFTENISEKLPNIYADRRALKQILLNILINAAKFTPKNGEISLTATARNTDLAIEIRDTGIGISEHDIGNLGNPFVRGESNPHKSQDGAGLGLAIVKSLVAYHDGDFTIASEVGAGTTVTVTLPTGAA
jgi:PAS domain S-box-containing protein